MFDTLNASEQSCIRSALGDELLESALSQLVLAEGDMEQWQVKLFSCLTQPIAEALFLSVTVAAMEEDMVDLGEDEMSCYRELVAGADVAALVALMASDPDDPAAAAEFFGGMAGCAPDQFISTMMEGLGVELEDLSEDERLCLREWAAAADWTAFFAGFASDDATAIGPFIKGMVGCAPDLVLSIFTGEWNVELEDLGEDERSCLREWAAGADWTAFFAGFASDDATAIGPLIQGMVGCAPDLFISAVMEGSGVELKDLSENERSCLREWAAATDWTAFFVGFASDYASAIGPFIGGMVSCLPDLALSTLTEEWNVELEDLSEDERSCLREWAAGADWTAFFAGFASDDATAIGPFIEGMVGCAPDLVLSTFTGEWNVELEDLSEDERSCLREWAAGADWTAFFAGFAADDPTVLGEFAPGLARCAPDLFLSGDSANPTPAPTLTPAP